MTRLNLGCGDHPIDGFVNLDKKNHWHFEDGLRSFADGSFEDGTVEGITISHALMYVALKDWPFVLRECARVLEPDGILRVTEDATGDPDSDRYGGHPDAVTLTTPTLVRAHMNNAGLWPYDVDPTTTLFVDRSLIQTLHGAPPKVFHVEGRKR